MAKKLVQFLMNRTFFTKVFISISVMSLIGIFSIASIYQHYFKEILIKNEMEQVQRSINQASLNLDNQLKRIINDMNYYFDNSGLWPYLLHNSEADAEKSSSLIDAKKTLESFRLRYSGDIESIFIYIESQDGITKFLHEASLSRVKSINYQTHQWYRDFKQKNDNIWTEPSTEHLFFQDRSTKTIYLTRGNYNINGIDGVIVARLNEKMFSDAFRLLVNSNLYIELQNPKNRKLYSSLPRAFNDHGDKWLELNTKLNYTDFKIKAYVNRQAIINQVDQIDFFSIITIIIVLICTLIISAILSLTLVRPIKKLLNLMKKVEAGNFDVRFPNRYSDEIGVLGKGFNSMISRVDNLIEQVFVVRMQKMKSEIMQKEAIILALQNQINPHFLYNTLEIINSHAIVNNVSSISRMSKTLADFFRYSNEHLQSEVTLKDELNHAEKYLKIQKERYPQIEVFIDIPENLFFYPIVKLTLQPLVENVYYHAFIGERDYYLKIYSKDINKYTYALYIEDNGEGIETEKITEMNKLFSDLGMEEITETWTETNNGIGLLNVHFRIRLRYGKPFGLHLHESRLGGLLVCVLLPKKGEELERGISE